jgi:hypothetical protein
VFVNGNVTALKLIDARRTKDLRMRAEAWTWAFADIKQGGQAGRALAVYDGGNRLWTDELVDIVKSAADAFVRLEDREEIVAAITAE